MTKRTFLALLAFAAFTSLGLPDGLIGVSWPSIRATFEQPIDALGILVAVTTAGYLTSSFLAGPILRVMPIGSVLAFSTAAAATALLGYALSPWWELMVVLGFLAGLGGGAVDAGLNAYGATHFSARTLNWLHAFFGVGTTVGPLIVTAVLGAGFGWQWSYVVVGGAQLLLAAVFFVTRRRWLQVRELGSGETPPVTAAPAMRTLRRPIVWLGMLTFFFYSGVEIAAAQWSYTLLTLGRGVEETTAGLYVSLYWGSLLAGRVLFGIVADRVPLTATLRACLVVSVLGSSLVWWEPVPVASPIGMVLMGASLAPIFASLISLTPSRVGRQHADSAIGFQIAGAALGGAALVGLIGVTARHAGLEVIGGAIFVLTAALLLIHEALVHATGKGGRGAADGSASAGSRR